MKDIVLDLLINDLAVDTDIDKLDELFENLEQIAPPESFVQQVMHKVAHLPRPVPLVCPWSHLDPLVVELDPAQLM